MRNKILLLTAMCLAVTIFGCGRPDRGDQGDIWITVQADVTAGDLQVENRATSDVLSFSNQGISVGDTNTRIYLLAEPKPDPEAEENPEAETDTEAEADAEAETEADHYILVGELNGNILESMTLYEVDDATHERLKGLLADGDDTNNIVEALKDVVGEDAEGIQVHYPAAEEDEGAEEDDHEEDEEEDEEEDDEDEEEEDDDEDEEEEEDDEA